MSSFLSLFTLLSIFFQTIISLLLGWLTLECKLQPSYPELQELTMTKLLYLHDPEACGRVYFYNYTVELKNSMSITTVQWPVKNHVASSFRERVKILMSLHVFWLIFCVAYMTQGHRPFGFYSALLPFTLTGCTILFVDILFTGFFLADVKETNTEMKILEYIDVHNDSIHRIYKTKNKKPFLNIVSEPLNQDDTSWIALLFAYASCRGVVLWVFNFWMTKDNYFEGLKIFRKF